MSTNPSRGHRHFRAPSMMIYKAIRGMIPHKSARGQTALKKLQVYDGCPKRFEKVKKMVIPCALRIMNLKAQSKYVRLGDLASEVGWKYGRIVSKLEKARMARGKAYHDEQVKKMHRKIKQNAAYRRFIPRQPPKKRTPEEVEALKKKKKERRERRMKRKETKAKKKLEEWIKKNRESRKNMKQTEKSAKNKKKYEKIKKMGKKSNKKKVAKKVTAKKVATKKVTSKKIAPTKKATGKKEPTKKPIQTKKTVKA